MKIKIKELKKLVKKVLLTQYKEEYAEMMKEVVMFGELTGRPSHGILRLVKGNYGVFVEKPVQGEPEFIKKTKISTLVDGKGNPGMLIGPLALKEVIRLALENGVGIVGTKNSFNSTGSLSYYVEKIALNNLIGIVFCSSAVTIAPFNITKALFGTNPISFGIPSKPHPFIFDMSTSSITYGTIMKAKSEKKPIPPNVAIDKEGNITTDPEKAAVGATLPFDNSYKGSGLAMIVEILASVWPGASFANLNYEKDGWGNLYVAFSSDLLSNTEVFKERMEKLILTLKNSKTKDNQTVRIPGEHTFKLIDENLKKGEIEVDENIIKAIKTYLE